MRERIFPCGLLLSLTLAACSGGGGVQSPSSIAAAGKPAVSGTIYGVSGQTINLNGGAGCGYVNVSFTNATTILANGYTLSPGVYANVYGAGTCATSFSATAIALGPAGNGSSANSGGAVGSGAHVLTADYLGGYSGTHAVSASAAAPILSWAEIAASDGNATAAAGIKTLDYIDPFRQAVGDPLYGSEESTFAHDCNGNRITIAYDTTTQYLMDPGSADLLSAMSSWQRSEASQGHIDAFFYDDIDTLYNVAPLPCGASQASWDAGNAAFIASSPNRVVFNGYGMNADSASLIGVSNVTGAMVEDCYGNAATGYTTGAAWTSNENLEFAAAAAGKLFFCYNTPTGDAAQSLALRQYIYASFLLSFGSASSVLWEHFSTPSGLHVFPESQLVPSAPLVAAGSVTALLMPGGAYVREYAACALAGSNVGPCAAVVNPSAASVPFPALSRTYGHSMALSGYGTLDGGTVSATGAAPPSVIPPQTGTIVFP